MRIVVVFPAPFGPRKPVTVPGSQRNETSSTTTVAAEALRQSLRFDHGGEDRRRAARRGHGRRATPAATAVDAGIDFGRGSRPRRAPTLWTMASTPRWHRALLPGELRDDPDGRRRRATGSSTA